MNDSARQRRFFEGDEAMLHKVLHEEAVLARQANTSRFLQLFSNINTYVFTFLPVQNGTLVTASKEATFPIDALASELREPVTGIFYALSNLANHLDSADTSDVENVQKRCYELLRVTSNLQNIYRAPHIKTLDAASLAQSLTASAISACRGQAVSISVEVPNQLLLVNANEKALSEAFLNVLRNSLQYTRDGNSIHVRLRRSGNAVRLTVEDKGLGIHPKNLPHIFNAYFSADPYGDDAPAPGLGLGLYVAQQAMRRFGGSIAAESQFGKGTRITMSLPLAEQTSIQTLQSNASDYLAGNYSLVYIHLCDYCNLPSLTVP